MSRVDRPVLKCDRKACGVETEDLAEMGRFQRITREHLSGRDFWDLCPTCFSLFMDLVGRRASE